MNDFKELAREDAEETINKIDNDQKEKAEALQDLSAANTYFGIFWQATRTVKTFAAATLRRMAEVELEKMMQDCANAVSDIKSINDAYKKNQKLLENTLGSLRKLNVFTERMSQFWGFQSDKFALLGK